MSVLLSVQGLTKRMAPAAVHRPVARLPRRRARWPHRPQRLRQVNAAAAAGRPGGVRHRHAFAAPHGPRRPCRPGGRFPPGQTARAVVIPALAVEPIEEHERATRAAIALTQVGFANPDQPADVLSGGWRNGWRWPGSSPAGPTCCSWTSRPTTSTCRASSGWNGCCGPRRSATWSPPTTGRFCGRSPTRSSRSIGLTPTATSGPPAPMMTSPSRREEFLEAQARRQEAVANQVRRETEWLGRKESAQRSKSAARIRSGAPPRGVGGAEIPQCGGGRGRHRLRRHRPADAQALTAPGIAKSLGGRPLFAGLDLALTPGSKLGLLGAEWQRQKHAAACVGWRDRCRRRHPPPGRRAAGVMFEQGRAGARSVCSAAKALCPNGDTVVYRDRRLHVAAWAKQFLFRPSNWTCRSAIFPAASRPGSASPSSCCGRLTCCCSTSRPMTWTSLPWRCWKTAWPSSRRPGAGQP